MTARTPYRILVATAAALLVAVAHAQGELAALAQGVDNLALVGLIAGAVAWYRATPVGKRIDGVVTVALFAMLAGAVIATALQGLGLLLFVPFHDVLGPWWGAAAAGLVAGIEAVFGVSITKYAVGLFKRAPDGTVTISAPDALTPGHDHGSQPAGPTPVAFILDAAERLLGRTPVGAALTALLPLITRYAQHPAVLTDDLRAQLQGQVLAALQSAGLLGTDVGQDIT